MVVMMMMVMVVMMMVVMVMVVVVVVMVMGHRRRRHWLRGVVRKGRRHAEADRQCRGDQYNLLHCREFPIYPQNRGSRRRCRNEHESCMNNRAASALRGFKGRRDYSPESPFQMIFA
jgi:hypothetical protein